MIRLILILNAGCFMSSRQTAMTRVPMTPYQLICVAALICANVTMAGCDPSPGTTPGHPTKNQNAERAAEVKGEAAEFPNSNATAIEPIEDGRDPFFVLFLGNSHTSNHNVPELVQRILQPHFESRNLQCRGIYAPFLDDLSNLKTVRETLRGGKWQAVVLQGQKISMSGRYEYSTEGAQTLSDIAHEVGTRAYWFSEWPRAGVDDENERTIQVYTALAEKNGDQVIHVGDAWRLVSVSHPDLDLYDVDGNHENERGAALTALVIASQIADVDPMTLGSIEITGVDDQEQEWLRAAAQQVWRASRDRAANQ
jgi:hypothetical protein